MPAATAGADQPLAPVEHGHFGAVPSSHLEGIGLDLMLAALAPDDQPDAGLRGPFDRVKRCRTRRQPAARIKTEDERRMVAKQRPKFGHLRHHIG
ncbi:MAG: hypothetical protein WCA23_02155, partial [Stellaceae bacterium]